MEEQSRPSAGSKAIGPRRPRRPNRRCQYYTSTTQPLSVVLLDPNNIARAGIKALLDDDPCFRVVGEAASDGVLVGRRLLPDLVVLDPHVNSGLDLQLIADLACAAPSASICIYTTDWEPCDAYRALRPAPTLGVRRVHNPCRSQDRPSWSTS